MYRWRFIVFVLTCSCLLSCEGCEKSKPYTPFQLDASAFGGATHQPAATEAQPLEALPPFARVRSILAPKNAQSWELSGHRLKAPQGRVFDQAVVGDFDRDQKNEVVAWLVPAKGPTAPSSQAVSAGAWLFSGESPPELLAEVPTFVPGGTACQHQANLVQSGPRTVTVDVRAQCTSALIPRSPTRAIIVLAPFEKRAARLTLRVAEAAPGETLDIDVDSTDRDGDAQDDVAVKITVATLNDPTATASASLLWLDRALGLAQDPTEPTQSVVDATSRILRAANSAGFEKTTLAVESEVRLYSTLCHESGTPRIWLENGSPIKCGNWNQAALRVAQARVRAAVKRKSFLQAIAALESADWFFGELSPAERKKLGQEITKALPSRNALKVAIAAEAPAALPYPRFSPLAFDASGSLRLLTDSGSVLVLADGTLEHSSPASSGGAGGASLALPASIPRSIWPLSVSSGPITWVGATFPCGSAFIVLNFMGTRGAAETVETPLLSPRPGTCSGKKAPNLLLQPLDFREGKLSALLGPNLIMPKGATLDTLRPLPGSPLSPDGELLVVPTSLGVVVTTTKASKPQSELWTRSHGSETSLLSDCVIQNRAERVACLEDGRPVLLLPQGALARSK